MTTRPSFALVALLACAAATAAAGCAPSPDESSEEIGEAELAQVVCPEGETIEGIDVSVWQGGSVNWSAVAGSGIKFAFARASYGTNKDTHFDTNWPKMKAAGLVRGAYQYWLPSKDPIAQAQAMLDIMGPLDPGDLPPVVDVEQTDGLSSSEIVARLTQWIAHVESAIGRKPIIYSGKYFWQDNVKSAAFVDYPLWIPNYSLSCPDLANGYWTNWHFFQYTDTGSVPGVSGNVDRNQFNGSLDDLLAFANGSPKYGAKFVSQSFPYASQGPETMLAGEVVEVSLEMQNTGTAPWDENTRLATTEPRDRESPFAGPEWPGKNRYAQVKGLVMPGETYKFTWKMHAPKEPGTYDEHMGLVQEGVTWFSDAGQGGPPDGQLQGIFEVLEHSPNPDEVDKDLVPILPDPIGETPDGDPDEQGDKNGDISAQNACSTTPGAPAGGGLFAAALALSALARRRRRPLPV